MKIDLSLKDLLSIKVGFLVRWKLRNNRVDINQDNVIHTSPVKTVRRSNVQETWEKKSNETYFMKIKILNTRNNGEKEKRKYLNEVAERAEEDKSLDEDSLGDDVTEVIVVEITEE